MYNVWNKTILQASWNFTLNVRLQNMYLLIHLCKRSHFKESNIFMVRLSGTLFILLAD